MTQTQQQQIDRSRAAILAMMDVGEQIDRRTYRERFRRRTAGAGIDYASYEAATDQLVAEGRVRMLGVPMRATRLR